MKNKNLLIYGGIAMAAYYLLKNNKSVSGIDGVPNLLLKKGNFGFDFLYFFDKKDKNYYQIATIYKDKNIIFPSHNNFFYDPKSIKIKNFAKKNGLKFILIKD